MVDTKEIRELIDLISRSNFSTFELEHEGLRLKLVKGSAVAEVVPETDAPAAASSAPVSAPVTPSDAASPPPAVPAESPAADGLLELKSPIVGTFYRAPSPDASPFVEPGDRVKKGQILCIVEAMKLMNEIESEVDAEVIEILPANAQPVEYGELLFRLRPLA